MLNQYSLKLPKAVYSGDGALNLITSILEGEKGKKTAVFTDQGIEKAGLLKEPLELIKASGKEYILLNEIPPEPTCDEAQKVIDLFKASGAEFIIAIGGGSVMDIAKLASVSATDRYGVRELLDNPGLAEKCVNTLMIPTTAGTGAEATPNSIVAVPEKQLKVGIVNAAMIADHVILDGNMIKKLPIHIAASTGVDALAHAIECFTSKKANLFSDTFALAALDLIINNIQASCHNPDDMQAKNAMLTGAFYGGVAITASGTTAVHALSYPLGGKYHIPHGTANAMLLAPVMRFNEPACRERLAQAYDRVAREHETAASSEEKSRWIINKLEEIVENLGIPSSLKDYGVKPDDLDELVLAGMGVQRLLVNNMREVSPQDAREIYQGLL